MNILQVALGNQFDIRDALALHGDVMYWDWTKDNRHSFNHALTSLVESFKPDFVFMQIQTPDVLSVQTAEDLSKKTKLINWTGDVRQPTPQWYIDIGRKIHLTLFTNMHDVDVLRKHGINADYLQIGVPDKIFKPSGPVKENVPDIVFMGNNVGGFPLSQYRVDMVRKLKERYGDRFGVYGNGWGKGTFAINDQRTEASYYRGAKIAINLSHFNLPRYTSDRMLRAMGSGCAVLSHAYDGIEQEFTNHVHVGYWSNFSELFERIDFLLNEDIHRNDFGKCGSQHVHKNHTWHNRIEQLMQMI